MSLSLLHYPITLSISDPFELGVLLDWESLPGTIIHIDPEEPCKRLVIKLDNPFTYKDKTYQYFIASTRYQGTHYNDAKPGDVLSTNFVAVDEERILSANPCDLSWWRGGLGIIGTIVFKKPASLKSAAGAFSIEPLKARLSILKRFPLLYTVLWYSMLFQLAIILYTLSRRFNFLSSPLLDFDMVLNGFNIPIIIVLHCCIFYIYRSLLIKTSLYFLDVLINSSIFITSCFLWWGLSWFYSFFTWVLSGGIL